MQVDGAFSRNGAAGREYTATWGAAGNRGICVGEWLVL
jgi:hypothetical protein